MSVNHQSIGYSTTEENLCTVVSGETVSDVVELGRQFAFIVIACDDTTGIDAGTTMTVQVSPFESGTLRKLRAVNGGAEVASDTLEDGAGDNFQTAYIDAIAVNRVRITLSKVTTADVVFKIIGVDSAKKGS